MLKRLIITSLFIAGIAGASAPAGALSSESAQQCRQAVQTVTLSAIDTTPYRLVGNICWRGSLQGKTVQLLVPGLTYGKQYWQWPYQPSKYSYAGTATDAGYATFSIDRLGIGQSAKPPAAGLTAFSSAYVAHQLVQQLRAGQIGGTAFNKVISVGHSFGSLTSVIEAGTYHDVDGVVLSGFAHDIDPGAFGVFSSFYPAQQDPKFSSANLPIDYFTTMPGTRAGIFYDTANADPAVIAQDEDLKQTATSGEMATVAEVSNPVYSQNVTVPVLIADGDHDILICNNTTLSCTNRDAILARENKYFTPQAHLEAYVLPNSGHDINLHLNAKNWFTFAAGWADRHVGTNGQPPMAAGMPS